MQRRPRIRQTQTLEERLGSEAFRLQDLAMTMVEGPERRALLLRALECRQAKSLNRYLSSEELKRPT